MDARHNVPRVGRILMARGRDAADVALLTSFGASRLERFTVWCDEVGPDALLPAAWSVVHRDADACRFSAARPLCVGSTPRF